MTPREERGLVIAATCRLKRADDGTWLVPSQTHAETIYKVNLETKACTCLDCTDGGFVCKHYYAATIVHRRDVMADGTVIETKSMTFTEKKVTYKQDWPAYNLAQATEKRRLRVLLQDLCRNLPERERPATRPGPRSEEHTSELQSPCNLVCRLLLEKKKKHGETGLVVQIKVRRL